MLIDADWCSLICWLILIDADWCWLVMIDADWCLLMLIDANWCSNKVQPSFLLSERASGASPVIFDLIPINCTFTLARPQLIEQETMPWKKPNIITFSHLPSFDRANKPSNEKILYWSNSDQLHFHTCTPATNCARTMQWKKPHLIDLTGISQTSTYIPISSLSGKYLFQHY